MTMVLNQNAHNQQEKIGNKNGVRNNCNTQTSDVEKKEEKTSRQTATKVRKVLIQLTEHQVKVMPFVSSHGDCNQCYREMISVVYTIKRTCTGNKYCSINTCNQNHEIFNCWVMLGAYIPYRKKNFYAIGLKFFYHALETQLKLETLSIHNTQSSTRAHVN